MADAKREIERAYGPVRVLINNAGIGILGPMEQATFGDWDWIMKVNVGGVINALVTFLPATIAAGEEAHIVNVASMGGIAALGAAGLYATSKFAVVGLSESLRTDMMGRNIGVSVYCPGTVKSNIGEGDALRDDSRHWELNLPAAQSKDISRSRRSRCNRSPVQRRDKPRPSR